MKQTGIITSGDHPKKIMDGTKIMTRRTYGLEAVNQHPNAWQFLHMEGDVAVFLLTQKHFGHIVSRRSQAKEIRGKEPKLEFLYKCPYGQVGDQLWCKQNYFVLDEYLLGKSDILYRLTDDRIYAILTMEVQDERYKTDEWSPSQVYPNLPQRGLHGGVGWSNLLTNKIQRLWAEGIRGLVSAKRTQQWQGLSEHLNVSSEPQGNSECSPPDMYGFSWDAKIPVISDQAFRWEWTKQLAKQFDMGDTRGKLDGQKSTRTRERRRKTSDGEADKLPNEGSQVGDRDRVSEPEASSENTWDVAGWHLRSCPPAVLRLKPSIFMPRWASRITLEITELWVELLRSISPADALSEGGYTVEEFIKLYLKINHLPDDANPWNWAIKSKLLGVGDNF